MRICQEKRRYCRRVLKTETRSATPKNHQLAMGKHLTKCTIRLYLANNLQRHHGAFLRRALRSSVASTLFEPAAPVGHPPTGNRQGKGQEQSPHQRQHEVQKQSNAQKQKPKNFALHVRRVSRLSVALTIELGMLQVKAGGILISLGHSQQFSFAVEMSQEGQAQRSTWPAGSDPSLFPNPGLRGVGTTHPVGQDERRMAAEIGDQHLRAEGRRDDDIHLLEY